MLTRSSLAVGPSSSSPCLLLLWGLQPRRWPFTSSTLYEHQTAHFHLAAFIQFWFQCWACHMLHVNSETVWKMANMPHILPHHASFISPPDFRSRGPRWEKVVELRKDLQKKLYRLLFRPGLPLLWGGKHSKIEQGGKRHQVEREKLVQCSNQRFFRGIFFWLVTN